MLNIFFLFSFCFLIDASAPALRKINLPPLKVTWSKEEPLVYIGIENKQGHKVHNKKSVTLKRHMYAGEKTTLIAIPKESKMAPLKVDIPDSLNEFHVAKELFSRVKKDELWLWGNTPLSKCKNGSAVLSFRFLDKKGFYKSASGLFIWKLKLSELPRKPVFYILPSLSVDMPSTIKSLSFLEVSKNYTKRCELYSGGECPYLFSINPHSFGMNSRISFIGNTNSVKDYNCPI